MSQTYNMPMASSAGIAASRTTINDAFDALVTTFLGTSLPGSPKNGQIAVLDDTGSSGNYLVEIRLGGAWYVLFPNAAAVGGGLLYKDGSIAMTGSLDMNSNQIDNLADPTANQDAATKVYVDDKTSQVVIPIGTLNASKNLYCFVTQAARTEIVEAYLITDQSDAEDGTDFWEATIYDLTGAADLLADHKTNDSGASDNHEAIVADEAWEFDFANEGQNNFDALTAGKVLELQITKNGSATDLTNVVFVMSVREKTAA